MWNRVCAGALLCLMVFNARTTRSRAGELELTLHGGARAITKVGAVRRWDRDGNPRVPVDPKAKIDAPRFDAEARSVGEDRWLFSGLADGRYDLVILAADRLRVEGFHYPPVAEFEAFLNADAPAPDDDERADDPQGHRPIQAL